MIAPQLRATDIDALWRSMTRLYRGAWTSREGAAPIVMGQDGLPELTRQAEDWRRVLTGVTAPELERVLEQLRADGRTYPPNPSEMLGLCTAARLSGLPSTEQVLSWLTLAETGRRHMLTVSERYGHPLALAVASQPGYRASTVSTGSPAARATMVSQLIGQVTASGQPIAWPPHAHDRQPRLARPPKTFDVKAWRKEIKL